MIVPPRIALAAAALAGLGWPGALLAQQDTRFAAYPGTAIEYYDLSPASASGLRRQLDAVRPTDPATGERHDAFTTYSYRWRLRDRPDGSCDGEVKLTTKVVFPRVKNEAGLSARDREVWHRYLDALEAHETGHLDRALATLPLVDAAMAGRSCESARTAMLAALQKANDEQRSYDRETRHGLNGGAHFP